MNYVLLYSGGLDSSVLLYDLKSKGHTLHALSVVYWQRHSRELEAAKAICSRLEVSHQILDVSSLRDVLSGNSQTDLSVEVPEGHYTEESMKLTVVPNRNMIFLSLALAAAISKKFDGVAYAAHGGDHAIYPDCRPEFVEAMQKAAALCDWHHVELHAPYVQMSKAEIVKRGIQLDVPFDLTWSCYKGKGQHCGKCGTCVERREAFALNQIDDPTSYEEKN